MSITIDNLTLTIDEAKALKKKLEAAFIVELPEPLFYVSHALCDAKIQAVKVERLTDRTEGWWWWRNGPVLKITMPGGYTNYLPADGAIISTT